MSEPSDLPDGEAIGWMYDGQSATRHEVAVSVVQGRLLIAGDDSVMAGALRRLDGRSPIFGRDDVPGWRLGFDGVLPRVLDEVLPKGERYGRLIDRFGLWWAAGIAAGLSAVAVLGAVYGLDLAARLIPFRWEQRIGDNIYGDFGDYACRTAAGQKALDRLAMRLSPEGRQMRVSVVDIPLVNAVALPGGRILIFDGLISEARSPDEVAGVLAHEIGHVEKRHVMVAMLRRFGLGLLLGSSGQTGQYGQSLLDSRYSRAAESEADDYSIAQLTRARINPTATADLFARLGKDEGEVPAIFAYLNSHPPSLDRKRRFAAAARNIPLTSPALKPAEWRDVRRMCAGRPEPKKDEFHFRF